MTRCTASVAIAAAAALFATSCNEEAGGGIHRVPEEPVVTALEAKLDRAEIVAGESVGVGCIATFSDGKVEPLPGTDFTLAAIPSDGILFEGPTLQATVAGTFEIACKLEGFDGDMPATLVVVPAEASRIVATVNPTEEKAGFPVDVTCEFEDAHGNRTPAPNAEVRATPSRRVSITGQRLTAEVAGTYDVECRDDRLERVPASLTILPGDPAQLVAEATPRSAIAGERVDVTCSAVDAYQNPVTVTANVNVSPTPDTIDATGFSSTTIGDFDVTCSLDTPAVVSEVLVVAVRPADPASIEILGLDPAKTIYASGDIVEPLVAVADVYGNPIENAQLSFLGMPANAITDLGNTAVLLGNGDITLIVSVDPPTHMNAAVEDQITVTIDGLPPEIDITFPARGEMVQRDPAQNLTIQGRVTDAVSPVTDLLINGQPVTFDGAGNFTASMNPDWGINVIEATAIDGAGNVRDQAQSYELASSYKRASPSRTFSGRIPDGIVAHLGQRALDDNNTNDVDDLATIAKLAIENANIAALIPSPVTTFNSDCSIPFVTIRGALRLYVDNVTYGSPTIDISSRNGGLYMTATIPNVYVAMHTSGDVCDIGVNLNGSATATRITISGNLNVSRSGGSSVVTMPSANVNIVGLNINLNLPGVISWAVNGIINLFSGAISNRLESAFRDVIRSEIPDVIEGFLDSFDVSTGFDLPAPLSTRLNMRAGLGMLQFDTVGGNLGLDTTLYATPAFTPEPRGGILQEQQILPSFSANDPLAIGLAYDLLNQAMYSGWYGGAFHIDLAQFFSGQVMSNGNMVNITAAADPLLPPVVTPSGNPQYPVEIQVGDLGIDLSVSGIPNFPMFDARVYAHATIQANVTVTPQGVLQFTIAPNPTVKLDVESTLDDRLDPAVLRSTLEGIVNAFIPQIVQDVIAGIPLPTFDLSALAGSNLPPNIVLGLGSPSVRFHSSYLILEGNLVQVP